jgi:hypothetical protein
MLLNQSWMIINFFLKFSIFHKQLVHLWHQMLVLLLQSLIIFIIVDLSHTELLLLAPPALLCHKYILLLQLFDLLLVHAFLIRETLLHRMLQKVDLRFKLLDLNAIRFNGGVARKISCHQIVELNLRLTPIFFENGQEYLKTLYFLFNILNSIKNLSYDILKGFWLIFTFRMLCPYHYSISRLILELVRLLVLSISFGTSWRRNLDIRR